MKGEGTMKRFSIGLAATLMLALAGVPASGQTDEQIRDYLTNDECYWPDFQRNPSFKICPPEDMARATGGRDGPGWIVTPQSFTRTNLPFNLSYASGEVPGLTVMYSCHIDGTVHYSDRICGFVSFRVTPNPVMATKGEQTHGYGYDLDLVFGIPISDYGRRPRRLALDDQRHFRLYKHEVLAIVDAAFSAFGVSGSNHGIECTNPNYSPRDHTNGGEILWLWPDDGDNDDDGDSRNRATWDGVRRPFGYQPEFRVEPYQGGDCGLAFRATP